MRTILRAVLVAGLVIGIGACGDDDDDDGGGATAGGAEVAVTIAGFAFDPTTIEASAGDATFAVTNDDTTAHTFTVEELDIDVEVGAGESGEASATLEPGTYDAVCRIHPNMTATVEVA